MNRLKDEKSPYLLQHVDNPVDWYPWCDAAFDAARELDRPVFLSVGYATCHWCHVMARESFRDPEVAALLNDAFICIKVDREERPDIDNVYMSVCRIVTGGGGWPLTILMTPERKPFFAGTYIPKYGRFGHHGMMELIPAVVKLWQSRRAELFENAEQILQTVSSLDRVMAAEGNRRVDHAALIEGAFEELQSRFDTQEGGFGGAPKFPMPHTLSFLLRCWKHAGSAQALAMVETTLQKMRQGGIFDQAGLGFHRYATDRAWRVPHFEKMLYDQALLAIAYTEAFQATGRKEYAQTVREILSYVTRRLTAPEGGFFCAEDAESEGEEGKFYLWTEAAVRATLPPDAANLIIRVFNVEPHGNFSAETAETTTDENILYRTRAIEELAVAEKTTPERFTKRLDAALRLLEKARDLRIRPQCDDKILTDWNGLMIAAFAQAARVFNEPAWLDAATRAAKFILAAMRTNDGRLLHRYRLDEAAIAAFLDDYAFFVWGLIEVYEAGFDAAHLKMALDLTDRMIPLFQDPDQGGFFFSAADATDIPLRKKEIYDGAIPSGNAVAMMNLLRLARLTGRTDLEDEAAALARSVTGEIAHMPSAYCSLLMGLDLAAASSQEIVIVGPRQAPDTQQLLAALTNRFLPFSVVLLKPTDTSDDVAALAPFTEAMMPLNGRATAYICTAKSCKQPVTTVEELIKNLDVA